VYYTGYTGPTCAIEQDECETSPCQNGGTCLDQINMFECECGTGWTGPTCDEVSTSGLPHNRII